MQETERKKKGLMGCTRAASGNEDGKMAGGGSRWRSGDIAWVEVDLHQTNDENPWRDPRFQVIVQLRDSCTGGIYNSPFIVTSN